MVEVTFFTWLLSQRERSDDVGTFARYAATDRAFPRQSWRLCIFLSRYEGIPTQRSLVKVAHRE